MKLIICTIMLSSALTYAGVAVSMAKVDICNKLASMESMRTEIIELNQQASVMKQPLIGLYNRFARR
jgi:hypothetical protein